MKKYSKFLLAFLVGIRSEHDLFADNSSQVEILRQRGDNVSNHVISYNPSEASSVTSQLSFHEDFQGIDDALKQKHLSAHQVDLLSSYYNHAKHCAIPLITNELLSEVVLYCSKSQIKSVEKLVKAGLTPKYKKINMSESADLISKAMHNIAADVLKELKENADVKKIIESNSKKASTTFMSLSENGAGELLLNVDFVTFSGQKQDRKLSFVIGFDNIELQVVGNAEGKISNEIILTFGAKDVASEDFVPINIRCRLDVLKYNQLVNNKEDLILSGNPISGGLLEAETKNRILSAISSKEGLNNIFGAMKKLNIEFLEGLYFSRHESKRYDNLDRLRFERVAGVDKKDILLGMMDKVVGVEVEPMSGSLLSKEGASFKTINMASKRRVLSLSNSSCSDALRYFTLKQKNAKLTNCNKKEVKNLEDKIKFLESKNGKTEEDKMIIADTKLKLASAKKLSNANYYEIKKNELEIKQIQSSRYNQNALKKMQKIFSDGYTLAEVDKMIKKHSNVVADAKNVVKNKEQVHTPAQHAEAKPAKKEKTTCGC